VLQWGEENVFEAFADGKPAKIKDTRPNFHLPRSISNHDILRIKLRIPPPPDILMAHDAIPQLCLAKLDNNFDQS
jgi:hypothetical protein